MRHFEALPPTREALLLQSAIAILKEDPMADERKRVRMTLRNEGIVKAKTTPIDTHPAAHVESGSTNSQPFKDITMTFDTVPEGYTEVHNPLPTREPTKQELKAAAALEKIAAKAAKKEAAEKAKADKAAARLAAVQAKNHSTKEERAAAKAERAERIAALDPDGKRKYVGSMLALADRVKQGVYVKSATGQLRSNNELAQLLDAVPVVHVITLAKIVLELPENPYIQLNTGQQSMNLRNRMRGAIKKGTLTLDAIAECIAENGFATATDWAAEAAAKREARIASAAANKAAKEARAAAKAVAA